MRRIDVQVYSLAAITDRELVCLPAVIQCVSQPGERLRRWLEANDPASEPKRAESRSVMADVSADINHGGDTPSGYQTLNLPVERSFRGPALQNVASAPYGALCHVLYAHAEESVGSLRKERPCPVRGRDMVKTSGAAGLPTAPHTSSLSVRNYCLIVALAGFLPPITAPAEGWNSLTKKYSFLVPLSWQTLILIVLRLWPGLKVILPVLTP